MKRTRVRAGSSNGSRGRAGGRGDVELLSGTVRTLAHGGEAVVETEAGVVLASGVLPGESVRLEVQAKRGGVRRGRVLSVTSDPSPDRVRPACDVVDTCGGCPLMIASVPFQQAHKVRLVAQALEGVIADGACAQTAVNFEPSPADLGYRRRARMAWSTQRGRCNLGYRGAGSSTIVAVTVCPVLTPTLSLVIPVLGKLLVPVLTGQGELELEPGVGNRVCVLLSSDGFQGPEVYAACQALAEHPAVAGVSLQVRGSGVPATWGSLATEVPGHDDLPLVGPPGGFCQANETVNRRLVELVVELAEPAGASILELYAGHGNLTVALAPHAAAVSAVEMNPDLVRACQANLASRGLSNVKVRVATAEDGAQGKPVDCVVLDPPRTGAKEVLDAIVARRPARIIYVSCDPMTLRRDTQMLAAAGYVPDRVHALDMFPHTAHVEAVVRFVRL